jgi:hypothetical protein
MKHIALCLCLVALTGCVTGAHVVTGTSHPVVPAESVKVYQTAPSNAEVVGLVVAKAIGDDQCAMDRGVKELKCQAGRIGGNGLIINMPVQTPGGVLIDPTTRLSGQALFVP